MNTPEPLAPATAVSVKRVIDHLMQLRATLAHALKADGLDPARFNDAQQQIRALDAQLKTLGIDPTSGKKHPPRTAMDRRQRRAINKSQGNSFTERMARHMQAGNADLMKGHIK
jgi:hypothetical protein